MSAGSDATVGQGRASDEAPDGVAGDPRPEEPPLERTPPEVGGPARVAGGVGSLMATMAHLRAGPGLVRGTRATLAMNQPDGFDCPGCAWPEPARDRSMFEFCENGAKALAWEATTRRADAAFFAAHSVAELARQSDHWLGQQGRLTQPMWLAPGATHYAPCTWPDALARLAEALRALPDPNQAAFYTSGRTSNEAAFLYQLVARAFGTNNLPDCSNLCHESSGVALKEAVGVGKGTVQLDDFELCDVILVIGQNPGTNHPRMMTTLQAAARRGCTIVAINPLAEAALSRFVHPQNPLEAMSGGTPIASLHLPVRVGGDVALLKGVMKALLYAEARAPGRVLDRAFIEIAHRRVRRARDGPRRCVLGRCRRRQRHTARATGRPCRRARRAAARDRVLGDGADPARARHREHPGGGRTCC